MRIASWIAETARAVKPQSLAGGPGHAAVARRTYDASPEELWTALTSPAELEQWFLPVSGDLREGGRFQLEGNAGGEILRCVRPRRLRVTWEFGEAPANEVAATVSPAGGGRTTLELEHTGPVAGDAVPGFVLAVGVGWDPALVALDQHLGGASPDKRWWLESEDAKQFMWESVRAWAGVLSRRRIASPQLVAKVAEETAAFYTGE